MTNNEAFFFGLLRVSMLQLLKSHGFDKALPSTVDAFTDLYVKFLDLLVSEVQGAMQLRGDKYMETVAIQDITAGMEAVGLLKPMKLLDVYGERVPDDSNTGAEAFKKWCTDVQVRNSRQVALPSVDLLTAEANGSKSTKPLNALPDYINQLQQKKEPSRSNSITKQPMLPDMAPQLPFHSQDEHVHELIEELINNGETDDWIRMVLARQRIELGKKHSRKPGTLENLPNIPSMKFSALSSLLPSEEDAKSEFLPSNGEVDETNSGKDLETTASEVTASDKTKDKLSQLIQYLPISKPENRLQNIALSYENEQDDADEINDGIDDYHSESASPATLTDEKLIDDIQSMGPMHLQNDIAVEDDDMMPMDYQFDDPDAMFDEQEDMDNTFQRRASLDFGSHFG